MGISFFALVPSTARSLQAQLDAGKITPAEVFKRTKTLKLVGACGLVTGCGLLLIYAFRLYD